MSTRSRRSPLTTTGLCLALTASGLAIGAGSDVAAQEMVPATTGSIVGWGYDGFGQVSGTQTGNDYISVAAGTGHGVALRADGSLISWGYDDFGQVSNTPTENDFIDVTANAHHSVALRADGTPLSWGGDHAGQVSNTPTGNDFTVVDAGWNHNVALRADGSIVSWGRDDQGVVSETPTGNDFTAVSAGEDVSTALHADGSLVSWGGDANRQVSFTPTGNDFTAVAVGGDQSVALRVDGSLVSWGINDFGQVSDTPTGNDFVAVATGWEHLVGLRSDGSLVSWGRDHHGQVSDTPTGMDFFAVAAGLEFSLALTTSEVPTASPYGELTPLTPARILDTRTGNGRSGVIAPLGENRSFAVQITGRGGVAADGVSAVVMNVTVTEPTAASHLRVWPTGADRPLVANLNFVAGQTVPNLVTVAVGANGQINVYNRFGSTHVIFDVVGFYADDAGPSGSRFHAIAPFRYFDTRVVDGGPFGPLGPNGVYEFNVLGRNDVPASGVTAVMLNVAVTQPTQRSYLTVFPGDVASRPLAANLNYVPGLTRSNQVVVRVPPSGVIKFFNRFGEVHLVVDAVGYFDDDKTTEAGRFIPMVPYRTFDTREDAPGPIGPDEWWYIGSPPGFAGIPPEAAEAMVLNVAATQPTQRSYLTVYPSHLCDVPLAASLNFAAGQTVPNHVVVRLSTQEACAHPDWLGTIAVYNRFGHVHVVLDVFGFYSASTILDEQESWPSPLNEPATRWASLTTGADPIDLRASRLRHRSTVSPF